MTATDRARTLAVLLLLAGLAAVAVMVAHSEMGGILRALASLGILGLALVVIVHVGAILAMGVAWSRLGGLKVAGFMGGRLLRDSASEVLPLSQIGGFVLGGRALALAGATAAQASALTVVDVTAELVAQMLYTVIGLVLLADLHPRSDIAASAGAAVAAMLVLTGGFVFVQMRGAGPAVRQVMKLAQLLGIVSPDAPDHGAALQAELRVLHDKAPQLVACVLWHLACWMLVGLETWLMLRLLGAPVGVGAALVIDSLISGLRSVAFMVPQALGVQEGGYIMLGALFGLSTEAALALSLVRRARDLTIGLPVLLVWQIAEGRRHLRRRGA
jgi:glycosyltransferase 2 family protein